MPESPSVSPVIPVFTLFAILLFFVGAQFIGNSAVRDERVDACHRVTA